MWCQIEHWVTLACLYIGAVFYSMLISSILSILQTTYLASRHFEEKLIQLDGYMRSKNVPAALRAKVKDHFHSQHASRKFYDEEEVLKVISPIHLKEIRQFEMTQLVRKVPILALPANKSFVQSLANSLVQRIVFAGQVIFEQRTTGDTMYFISSGLVELYLPSKDGEAPYLAIGDGCVSQLLGTDLDSTSCFFVLTLACFLFFLDIVLWRGFAAPWGKTDSIRQSQDTVCSL